MGSGLSCGFDSKARTKLWIEALEDVRNAIAHSRPLLQFERELAAGVSGQLRNQITIYRTSKEPANQHYPVIESVRDRFGQPSLPPHSYFGDRTLVRLDVGDVLSFDCTGSDQRGRDLEWALYGLVNDLDGEVEIASAQGASAVLSWMVAENFVGESKLFRVRLRAVGARHFRYQDGWPVVSYDDQASFAYAVNPPYE